jgi:glycosyltransferase involved in cell wall biosynthesis
VARPIPGSHAREKFCTVSMGPTLHAVIDWMASDFPVPIELEALPNHLSDDLEWPCLDVHAWLALPAGRTIPPEARPGLRLDCCGDARAVLRRLIRKADDQPRDLLICAGTILPGVDAIGQLRATLHSDAMFGAVAPRVCVLPAGDIVALGPDGGEPGLVPRARLADIDEIYILPERLFPCMLIKGELLANLDPPSSAYGTLGGALLELLRRARRRGFRVVVDNRSVVGADRAEQAAPPSVPLVDEVALAAACQERELVAVLRDEQHQGSRLETLLAAARPERAGGARRVLLDCTGMQNVFNGTSLSMLGVLDGIHGHADPRWSITVMARASAQSFFSLASRYPRFRVVGPEDGCRHAVALRLSQAWGLATWVDLHRRALSVAVSVLDTIGIDILYTITPGVPEAFQFTAEYADGLLYISAFSRSQFRRRFRVAAGVLEIVHYLSLDPRDHARGEASLPDAEPFVLIVGNEYDHKDVLSTAQIVAEAFPMLGIKALGLSGAPLPGIEALPSGALPTDLLERLYATAQCVIYPSFYEGFGLPAVKALAYKRPVFARRSPVLDEIAARVPPGGRLVGFSTRLELVEALGAELHGKPVDGLLLGSAVDPEAGPLSWKSIAALLADFIEQLATHTDVARWRRRDDALRLAAVGVQS